ncbi:MAG: hypothetical protein GY874_08140 [Desulfobacteraceae bacterium]|nr:hypothetical protein [Desulfobacteraceae bacterium]
MTDWTAVIKNLKSFKSGIHLTDQDTEVLLVVCWFYIQAGKAQKALDLLPLCLRNDPFDMTALKMACYALTKVGGYKQALAFANKLLEKSDNTGDYAVGAYLKGRALLGAGRKVEATNWIRLFISRRKEYHENRAS